MYNIFKKHRRWKLICAILSLSLLTVMAGAAVAPALGLIREHFADTDTGLVQMIVSMPAIFIALTNLFLFKPLCKRFRARTLLMIGLALYTVFGCAAGLFSSIAYRAEGPEITHPAAFPQGHAGLGKEPTETSRVRTPSADTLLPWSSTASRSPCREPCRSL